MKKISKRPPPIAVLVATRNRPESLLRCLKSILGQDYPNIEVLILDDFSKGIQICDLVSSEMGDPRVKCFRSDQQLGVAGARNFLMRKASGEIFIIIDDDAVFQDRNDLSLAVRHLSENPNVGILAFRIVDHFKGRENLLVPFSRWWRFKYPDIVEKQQAVSYYVGAGHAIRRDVVEQCGFYQEDLGYGEEEMDLSYRVSQAGVKVLYTPDIVVHHYPEPTVFDSKGKRSEIYFTTRNRIWLAYKYLPSLYLVTYLLFWLGVCLVKALRRLRISEFLVGVKDGVKALNLLERTPLDKDTTKYLRKHFGRLWY